MSPRRGSRRLSAGIACAASIWVAAPVALAQERAPHAPLPGSDGVYGRFDGDLTLAAALGLELEAAEPRGALRASAHYLWSAGVYARYAEGFGQTDERATRVLSFGVDLRPLFLPRFALDYEQGPALLDLTLDSLALTAGAFFAQPEGAGFGEQRGFEAGLGLAAPLLGEASGPWLEARAERRFPDEGQAAFVFSAQLSWQWLSVTPERRP